MSDPVTEPFRVEPLLISVRDVALMLRISTRSVWRLYRTGKLIAPVKIGGSVRWRREELQRWIDDGCPVSP
jgi:predicted DNA-binding transcriptional regulator AlpA